MIARTRERKRIDTRIYERLSMNKPPLVPDLGVPKIRIGIPPIRRIDVAEVFKRQDLPVSETYQPTDYTATLVGEARKGLISQEGLYKRAKDIEAVKLVIFRHQAGPSKVKTPVGKGESAPVGGILAMVDKFFNAVNRLLGE